MFARFYRFSAAMPRRCRARPEARYSRYSPSSNSPCDVREENRERFQGTRERRPGPMKIQIPAFSARTSRQTRRARQTLTSTVSTKPNELERRNAHATSFPPGFFIASSSSPPLSKAFRHSSTALRSGPLRSDPRRDNPIPIDPVRDPAYARSYAV